MRTTHPTDQQSLILSRSQNDCALQDQRFALDVRERFSSVPGDQPPLWRAAAARAASVTDGCHPTPSLPNPTEKLLFPELPPRLTLSDLSARAALSNDLASAQTGSFCSPKASRCWICPRAENFNPGTVRRSLIYFGKYI